MDKALRSALKGLHSRDPDTRRAAAQTLGQIGDPAAVPDLLTALRKAKNDALLRLFIVNALDIIGDERAVPALAETMHDRVIEVSVVSATALGRIGEAAIPSLAEKLQGSDDLVRYLAVEALASAGEAALHALLSALQDKEALVRNRAVCALWEIGSANRETTSQIVPPLLRVLGDHMDIVRQSAVEALAELGGADFITHMVNQLDTQDVVKRHRATWALGRVAVRHGDDESGEIMCEQALPALLEVLSDRNAAVRRAAVSTLGMIGRHCQEATSILVAALQEPLFDENHQVHWEAALALGWMGEVALPVLTDALHSDNRDVCYRAISALWLVGQDAVPALLDVLPALDSREKERAVTVLGYIADPRAVSSLGDALQDDDRWVRERAAWALSSIGTPDALATLEGKRANQEGSPDEG